jgi:hypothetical protein
MQPCGNGWLRVSCVSSVPGLHESCSPGAPRGMADQTFALRRVSEVSAVAAGGLILDIGGGLTLASAFLFKTPDDAVREAGSYWDSNPYLLPSLAKQTADAWIGAVLLTLGFSAQLAQAVGAPGMEPLGHARSGHLHRPRRLASPLRPWNVRRVIRIHLALSSKGSASPSI